MEFNKCSLNEKKHDSEFQLNQAVNSLNRPLSHFKLTKW